MNRVLFLSLALLLAVPVAVAQHGSISIGLFSPESSFQPDLSTRDIKLIVRVLGLKADEQAAVENLHAGYVAMLKSKSDEIRVIVNGVLEEAEAMEDRRLLEPAQAKISEWEREAERIKKAFLDDLRSLLTGEQDSRWGIVERELRRLKSIGGGRLSGEAVDVVRLVEEVAPESLATPAVAELAERYAQDLDRLMLLREQAVDANSKVFDESIKSDPKRAEQMWRDALAARRAIQDLNTRYAREFAAQLPAAGSAELDRRFFEAAHVRLCKPTRTEAYIRAAAKLNSLTGEQAGAITAIMERYDRARLSLLRRQAEVEAEGERTRMPATLAKALGRTGPEADDSFDGRTRLPADHPMVLLRRERFELDRDTRRRIDAVLTRDQRESVPDEKAGYATFENWEPYGL